MEEKLTKPKDVVPTGQGSFSCPECGSSLTTAENLALHIKNLHRKEKVTNGSSIIAVNYNLSFSLKDLQCPICDYATGRPSNLSDHVRAVHNRVRPFKCHLCAEFSASKRGNLDRHVKNVHVKNEGVSVFMESSCGLNSALKVGKFGKAFSILIFTYVHIYYVQETLQCPHCDMQTTSSKNLKWHILAVHEDVRLHSCHLCAYKSARMNNLKVHIEGVHVGARHYRCHLCDYSTDKKANLARHLEKVHPGQVCISLPETYFTIETT